MYLLSVSERNFREPINAWRFTLVALRTMSGGDPPVMKHHSDEACSDKPGKPGEASALTSIASLSRRYVYSADRGIGDI